MPDSTSTGARSAGGNPSLDSELKATSSMADPYPFYDRLRAEEPVHWMSEWGCWVLSRYVDVTQVLREDGRTYSTTGRVATALGSLTPEQREQLPTIQRHYSGGLLLSDPPDHTRMRGVINRIFTPRTVERQGAQIEHLANQLLDAAERSGGVDLVRDYALPLPASVVADVLGIPIDRSEVDRWVANSHDFVGPPVSFDNAVRMEATLNHVRAFLLDVAASKRRSPADDVMSRMVAAMDEGLLSEDELLATCVTFVMGGYMTTAGLISSGIHHLLRDRCQLDELATDTSLLPTAVDEFLRYESPGRQAIRVATTDHVIDGHEIAKGDVVLMLLGAANRDPDAFPEPSRFDIARKPNRHLAFVIGEHHCVGAPLARLEGQIATRTLLTRFPGIRHDDPDRETAWIPGLGLRMLERLPVSLR